MTPPMDNRAIVDATLDELLDDSDYDCTACGVRYAGLELRARFHMPNACTECGSKEFRPVVRAAPDGSGERE